MNQLNVLEAAHPELSGYRVDVSRGERIGRVSSEWFSRPADERYLSLSELHAALRAAASCRPAACVRAKVRIERRERNDHYDGENCEIRPKARDGDCAGRCEQCGGRGDHEQACL
jgi:hypothetical protein